MKKTYIALLLFVLTIFLPLHKTLAADLEITAQDFGYPETIRLEGTEAEQTISFPLQEGLSIQQISFTTKSTPNITDGFISIESDNRPIDTVLHDPQRIEHIFPLTDFTFSDDLVNITFRSIADITNDAICDSTQTTWVDISDITILVTGDAVAPQTIRDFWTPALERLTFYLGNKPSLAQIQSAIHLANFAQQQTFNDDIEVRIVLENSPAAGALFGETERVIAIGQSAEPVLLLENQQDPTETLSSSSAVLRISGPSDALPEIVEKTINEQAKELLLTNQIVGSMEIGKDESNPFEVTFKELGFETLGVKGTGIMRQSLTLPQSALGDAVENLQLKLAGKHTILTGNPNATLNVFFNDTLVASRPLSGKTETESSFNLTVPIEDALLQRDNNLELVVDYTSKEGHCRGLHPLTVDFDTNSSFVAEHLMTYLPSFDHYPQILLQNFYVAVDRSKQEDVQQTVQLLTALQKLSPVMLKPTVISPNEINETHEPLVVVSGNEEVISSFNLPIDTQSVQSDGIMKGKFAFLHAFVQENQRILLLGNKGWSEGGSILLSYLLSEDGWYTTQDDTMIINEQSDVGFTQINTEPVSLQSEEEVKEEIQAKRSDRIIYIGIPVAALIAAAVVVYLYRKSKKKDDE